MCWDRLNFPQNLEFLTILQPQNRNERQCDMNQCHVPTCTSLHLDCNHKEGNLFPLFYHWLLLEVGQLKTGGPRTNLVRGLWGRRGSFRFVEEAAASSSPRHSLIADPSEKKSIKDWSKICFWALIKMILPLWANWSKSKWTQSWAVTV